MRWSERVGAEERTLILLTLLCTLLVVVATFGEFAVGVLSPAFGTELGTSPDQLGQLLAAMFVVSALMAIPSGVLVDFFSPRRLMLIQVILASLAFGSFAIVTEPVHLFIVCAVVGGVMSFNGPLTNRIVVDYFPVRWQATAIGWKSLGLQVSALLAGLVFAITEPFLHWRAVVVIVMVVMLGFAVWAQRVIRSARPRSERSEPAATADPADALPADALSAESATAVATTAAETTARRTTAVPSSKVRVAAPIVWWLIPYSVFTVGGFTAIGAYFVYYAVTVVGIDAAQASLASAVAAGVSIAARFIWLRGLTTSNEVRMLAMASGISAAALIFLAMSPMLGMAGFWLAAVVIGGTVLATSPLQQVIMVRNTHPRYVGRVGSLVGIATSVSLAGMPALLSVLLNVVGLDGIWLVVAGCVLLGTITMLAFAALSFMGRRAASKTHYPSAL